MTTQSLRERTVLLAYVTFIGLGLTGGLLGVAWPSMQKGFDLSLDAVSALYVAQTAGYTVASFSIGRVMARWGSGRTLLMGIAGAALCMFGIAVSSTWLMVVAISLLFGLGSGLIDAGLNLYIATYHSARQMTWLHASFGIGITLGPLIMTSVLERNLQWQVGYAFVGALLLVVILIFAATCREWQTEGFQTREKQPVRRSRFAKTLRVPVVWWSMATFVVYVGAEIGIGQWAFVLLTESRAVDPGIAGPWTSAYWGAFTGGRILFGAIANRFHIQTILRYCMLAMILGTFLFWWNPTSIISLLGLVVVGFAQAPVFPMLMSDTAARVGMEHAENTISLQMGAVGIGSAALPGLIGMIGDDYGLETMAATFVLFAVLVLLSHEMARLFRATGRVPKPLA